jgi:hypothetical protein
MAVVIFSLFSAITRADTTPEEIVVSYFRSIQQGDMKSLAANMYPDELAKFRDTMLPVMEKGIRQAEENTDDEDGLAMIAFSSGDDIETIKSESAETFFTRFMNWVMTINPEMKLSLEGAKVEPVGHVDEGELTHVVYRMHVEMLGTMVSQISAITLKKYNDTWKLMLTGEMEGMSKMLQATINQLM